MATAKTAPKTPFPWGRFLIWTGLIIGLILLILVVLAVLFEEKIANMVIDKLRGSLKTELKVERAELSLIRNFPSATVRLRNVELQGNVGEAPLAKFEQLSLRCSIWGLLTGDYDFRTIAIANGEMNVLRDKKGKINYDVWASDTTTTTTSEESSPLSLSIRRMELQNMRLRYTDQKMKQDVDMLVQDAYFSGDFSNDLFSMDSYAEILSNRVKLGDDVYLENKKLAYDAVFEIDNLNSIYKFSDIKLTFESNDFAVTGELASVPEGLKFNNVAVKGDEASLNSVLKMMPQRYVHFLDGFDSYAKIYFSTKVDGILSEKSSPLVDVQFGLKDGHVTHTAMEAGLKGMGFDIRFTNGDGKRDETAIFELNNFKATLNGKPIELKLVSKGMANPMIDFSFNGELDLAGIYGWFGKQMSAGSGTIDVKKLFLQGRYSDLQTAAGVTRSKFGGLIHFNNAKLVANSIDIGISEGKVDITSNDVTIGGLMLQCADSDLIVNGSFTNLLPVLFADSLNSKNAFLILQASILSNKLDVDKLLEAFTPPQTETIQDSTVKDSIAEAHILQRAYWSQFLRGRFVANVNELKYQKLNIGQLNGMLEFEDQMLLLRSLKMNTMQGELELNSRLSLTEQPKLEAYLDCKNLNVEQFLSQMDNFGQETLKDRHLHGTLNSLIKVEAFWDEHGHFMDDKLFVVADVNLTDGELIGFTPLEKFAAFIKIQDLRHIKFATLTNQFRIENRAFYMPAMFIQSNALNLVVSGYHSFDQDIDYKLKVNVSQVIAQKFKKYNPELRPLKAKKNGLFNLYGRIAGNINTDDYKFIKGKKGVKEELEAQLAQDMPALSNTLRAEFEQSAGLLDVHSQIMQDIQTKLNNLQEPEDWQDLPGEEETTTESNEW